MTTISDLADAPAEHAALVRRAAVACLVAHAALTLFSAYAFSTFLAGPPPAWLQSPGNQAILRLGWRFGGPSCVVLGALAGLLHAAGRLGQTGFQEQHIGLGVG